MLVLWKTLIGKMLEFAGKTLSEKQFKTREVLNPLSDPGFLVPTPEGRDMDKIKSRSFQALWEMLGMLLLLTEMVMVGICLPGKLL